MTVRRGDIVLADGPGEFANKPRPFLVVQSDLFNETHSAVTLCPVTSMVTGNQLFRVRLEPSEGTGLKLPSEAQIDKVQAFRTARLKMTIGSAPMEAMLAVDTALRRWLDL